MKYTETMTETAHIKQVHTTKTEPVREKTAEKKQKGKTGLFPIFLLIIFIVSLTMCGYLLYVEIDRETGIRNMEDDIQNYVTHAVAVQEEQTEAVPENTDAADTGSVTDSAGIPDSNACIIDWDGIKEQSSYVTGWIQVPGIERISYPVVQHPDDNQFFLTHDWKGDPLSAGAIFMNKSNSADFTDMNTVIYGHRMKAGSMFGSLKYYADQAFLDEHPYFYIYTPDGQKLTYEIICYSSVTDGSDAYLMHFDSPDERMAYFDMMIYNAITKRDVELDRLDTTVILSTCNTTGYYDRLVVLGKLVEINVDGQTVR